MTFILYNELPAGTKELESKAAYDFFSLSPQNDLIGKSHKVLSIKDNLLNLNLVEEIFNHRPEIKFLSATHRPRNAFQMLNRELYKRGRIVQESDFVRQAVRLTPPQLSFSPPFHPTPPKA